AEDLPRVDRNLCFGKFLETGAGTDSTDGSPRRGGKRRREEAHERALYFKQPLRVYVLGAGVSVGELAGLRILVQVVQNVQAVQIVRKRFGSLRRTCSGSVGRVASPAALGDFHRVTIGIEYVHAAFPGFIVGWRVKANIAGGELA